MWDQTSWIFIALSSKVSTVDECQSETADSRDIGDNLNDKIPSLDALNESNDVVEISANLTKLVKREFDGRTISQNFSLKVLEIL